MQIVGNILEKLKYFLETKKCILTEKLFNICNYWYGRSERFHKKYISSYFLEFSRVGFLWIVINLSGGQ